MKNNQFWTVCVISTLLFSACSQPEEQSKTQKPETAESVRPSGIRKSNLRLLAVSEKDKTVEVLVSGRVVAKNTTALFAEVQGRIEPADVQFKEGVKFQKGQTLISIDSREFALNLESQRSSFLNTLTAMMPDLKEDYSVNYDAWLVYVQQYRMGEPLKKLPETTTDSERYFVTSRGVYSSYFSIKAQEERLKKYTISAPYNGIITQAAVDLGGLVSPGQPLGQVISTSSYELEAGVSLQVANALKTGDQLSFGSNQQSGEWIGTVVRIGGTVDSKTQSVSVFFSMKGSGLKPGMYLEGSLNTKDFNNIFVVHSSLIGRDQSVLILDKDLIVRKPVEAIEYVRDSVLVRGLKNQDQLILNQFSEPVEGQKVILQ